KVVRVLRAGRITPQLALTQARLDRPELADIEIGLSHAALDAPGIFDRQARLRAEQRNSDAGRRRQNDSLHCFLLPRFLGCSPPSELILRKRIVISGPSAQGPA